MANTLSLFSGAGGLDIGFIKAGFNIVASVELEEIFCKTLEENNGTYFTTNHKVICADITKYNPDAYELGKIDFIIGGPPCQSFSAAGRRAGGVNGVNDHRGSLFSHYCRLIDYYKPKGFLFENVRGMLQANHGNDWNVVNTALKGLGYVLSYKVLDAADYGVPQHRERLIIVGLKDKKFLFPRPTNGPDSLDGRKHVGAWEAIKDLDDPNEIVPPYGGKYGELLPEIPPGLNYLHFTPEMGHPRPRFAWRSKFSNFLYKANPDLPVKTIVASQSRYDGPFHWKNRKFTLSELKRLQTFPDDYVITGSKATVIKQIGNSVPPKFAEAIAKAIMVQVFDPGLFPNLPLLREGDQLTFDKNKRLKANRTKSRRRDIIKPGQMTLSGVDGHHLKGKDAVSEPLSSLKAIWVYSSAKKRGYTPDCQGNKRFEVKSEKTGRIWNIIVKELDLEDIKASKVKLHLNFSSSIGNGYDSIQCTFIGGSLWDIYAGWDAIHDVIKSTTSYASVKDLYGHFTEPHPKFNLITKVEGTCDAGISRFLQTISKFDYLDSTHSLDELAKMFDCSSDPLELVKRIRAIRYDIRVHNTNKTIPIGQFRCCYPFPNAIDELSYVGWKD